MSINDSRQISIQSKEHGCYDQYIMSTTKCTIVYNTCTSTYLLCRYLYDGLPKNKGIFHSEMKQKTQSMALLDPSRSSRRSFLLVFFF